MLFVLHGGEALKFDAFVHTRSCATARKVLQSKGGEHQNGNQSIHKSAPLDHRRLSAVVRPCQRRFFE